MLIACMRATLCRRVVLCGLVLLSKLAKDTQVNVGNSSYVQQNYLTAVETLSPIGFAEALASSRGQADDIEAALAEFNGTNLTGVPNAIFPLALYLAYAANESLAPFDGTFLAVTPDTDEVRALLNESLHWPRDKIISSNWLRPTPQTAGGADTLRVRYFDDEKLLDSAAMKVRGGRRAEFLLARTIGCRGSRCGLAACRCWRSARDLAQLLPISSPRIPNIHHLPYPDPACASGHERVVCARL